VEDQIPTILRDQVGGIMLATVFLFIGLAACGIAAIRDRGRVRILLWFGIFNAMYGVRILAQLPAGFSVLPQSTLPYRPYVIASITCLITIPAVLFWLELSLGNLRRFLQITVVAATLIGIAGICVAFITKSPYSFMPYNSAWQSGPFWHSRK
jgi:hypothetical protein